jgi:propionyl-CoA carboxylase alpha chain
MGDKIASKELAAKAKVNTIPGYNSPIESAEKAVEIAKGIGYPVMIKASAGGGGKGLRVAWNDKDAFEGFTSCRNEARNSFGDDRVFIEKFVEEPRHIEIQVLGDRHGNCVYLWERECSIQRRHQKVIEEAPSPFLDDATRKAMGEQAVALAKAVNYQSAGTVEFVVGRDKSFYFLEMNTRLQVEHPVTECITGLDLVEQMIRVAAGEKLAFKQSEIARNGWAIECRINAEDPYRNFLPSTGRLVKYRPPEQNMEASQPVPQGGGVRVDTGVYEGGEIPMFYDSMIAKLITHGRDRNEAIARMRDALNGFVIRGISSNIPFQAALLAHSKFTSGDFNTGFIAEHYPKGFSTGSVAHEQAGFLLALAAVSHRRSRERAATLTGQRRHREVRIREDFVIVLTDESGRRDQIPVTVRPVGPGFHVTIAGQTHEISFEDNLRDIAVHGSFDGRTFCAQIERAGLGYRISHNGASLFARVFSPRQAELEALMPFKAPPDLSKVLLSPMPGLLVDVAVQAGQTVRAGEKLAAIEAMKMENILFAAQDCVVTEVVAKKGESLAVDQVIMRFE